MTPVRFGSETREMLGFYHGPARAVADAPAVLLCSPFGPEAIRSYRMMRLMADRLSASGRAVLRFDYHGTGDSPGEDDAASLPGWAGDVCSAHRELVARSGKSSVSWVGLRLGAAGRADFALCAVAGTAVPAARGRTGILLPAWPRARATGVRAGDDPASAFQAASGNVESSGGTAAPRRRALARMESPQPALRVPPRDPRRRPRTPRRTLGILAAHDRTTSTRPEDRFPARGPAYAGP